MGVPHFDGVRVDGSACYLAVQSQMLAFAGRSEPFTEFERGCGGNNLSVRQLRPFISFATGIVDIILDDGLFVFANAFGRSLFLFLWHSLLSFEGSVRRLPKRSAGRASVTMRFLFRFFSCLMLIVSN